MENGKQVVDGNIEGIKKSLEGSLKRLKIDYIDLYYLHRVDPNVPIEDIAYLMKNCIKQRKIKHWEISEAEIEITWGRDRRRRVPAPACSRSLPDDPGCTSPDRSGGTPARSRRGTGFWRADSATLHQSAPFPQGTASSGSGFPQDRTPRRETCGTGP